MASSPSTDQPEKRPSASLLGSLRTAVKKVRFLLSFSATRWILSSIAGARAGASAPTPRRLSFSARRPSLLDAEDALASPPAGARPASGPSRTASLGPATSASVSRTSSSASSEQLSRASSSVGASSPGDDDIDRRADQFIANFYKHIQMERQVSLQLRYCRDNSFERTKPSR